MSTEQVEELLEILSRLAGAVEAQTKVLERIAHVQEFLKRVTEDQK